MIEKPTTPVQWSVVKRFQTERASQLADWHSVKFDLDFALAAAELVYSKTPDDEDSSIDLNEEIVIVAIWNASVISYSRCFNGGIRMVRKSDFDPAFQASGDAKSCSDFHDHILNLRSKFIAHSVNRFEETQIAVYWNEAIDLPDGILAVGPVTIRKTIEPKQNVAHFITLIKLLIDECLVQVERLIDEVSDEAKAMSEIELRQLSNIEIQLPMKPVEVAKGRKRC